MEARTAVEIPADSRASARAAGSPRKVWALALALAAGPVLADPEHGGDADAPDVIRAIAGIGPGTAPPRSVSVTLPDGRRVSFRTEAEHYGADTFGLRGWSADSDRLSLFVADGELVAGDVHATGGRYRLVHEPGGHRWVPLAQLPPELPFTESPVPRPAAMVTGTAPVAAPDAEGNYEVDVLVLYSERLLSSLSFGDNGARRWIRHQLFLANTYFANSFAPIRYRLAGAIRYTPEQPFGAPSPMVDDAFIKAARDRTAADLVLMVEGDGCHGQSMGFNSWHHDPAEGPPEHVNAERDAFAYAATQPGCLPTLVAHELGHNLAAGHDIAFSFGVASYWRSYAHGWHCGDAGDGPYYSVMHYAYFGNLGGAYGDFFSNPALVLDGEACGSAGVPGSEVTEADNVRTMTAAAPYVAAYRTRAKDTSEAPAAGHAGALGGLFLLVCAVACAASRSARSAAG